MHKLSLFGGEDFADPFPTVFGTPLFGTFGVTRVKMTPAVPGEQGSCGVFGRLPRGQGDRGILTNT